MSQEPIAAPIIVEARHPTGAVARAILPSWAQADAAVIHIWLRNQRSNRTQETYASNVERFYRDVARPLKEVTLEELQDFAESLYDLAPASQATMLASIKSLLTFCADTRYLPYNVGKALKLPRLEHKLAQRILSETQVHKMLALEEQPRNHLILLLLYAAGLRAEELCNLRRRDVQENGEAGQVTVSYGKGGKTRSILLQPASWKELLGFCGAAPPEAYVFRSRQSKSKTGRDTGRRLDESQVYRIVEAAAIHADVETYIDTVKRGLHAGERVKRSRVSPHWLRHAHASHALRHGAELALVRDTLGHSSIETTGRYAHARPNDNSSLYLPL
jgi:integrase/recombinase XerD